LISVQLNDKLLQQLNYDYIYIYFQGINYYNRSELLVKYFGEPVIILKKCIYHFTIHLLIIIYRKSKHSQAIDVLIFNFYLYY